MKKYLVIYNPSSGKESAAQRIFQAVKPIMETEDAEVTFYATKKKSDGEREAQNNSGSYDMIISCGGDGTVHEVVNGIMKSGKETSLGILPAGTINDFAEQLGIPKTPQEFGSLLTLEECRPIDVGRINTDYFINVVCGGAFTNIPHNVPIDAKTIFGKYAYYFQAAVEIPGQLDKSYDVTYTVDGEKHRVNTYLFLISNTPGAGGFRHLCPDAKADDGLLDIVIFEKSSPADLMQIFTKVFNGQHVKHQKVHYFQAKNIKIECVQEMVIDVDGEMGGYTPVEISSVYRPLKILAPNKNAVTTS